MMMLKRLLGLAGVALLMALGSETSARAENIPLCFVTFSLQVAYFQSSVAGGKKAAQELGADLTIIDPQADAGKQVTGVEDCIARRSRASSSIPSSPSRSPAPSTRPASRVS